MTREGAVVGTLDYLSPEQAQGGEVDGRSDLYALGILLFEMVSGRLPFDAGSHEEVLAQRLAGQPKTLRQVGVEAPPRVQRIINRCLQREPRRRYASATELLADLEGSGKAPATGIWLRRVASALTILALVGAGWWLFERRRETATPTALAGDVAGPRLHQHAIAVLPLADQSGRAEMAWLAAGVPEMLAAALAESPELRVVDNPRVERILGDLQMVPDTIDAAGLRQLAEVLAVDRLVTGSLRSLDPGIRVDLRVVTADLSNLPTDQLAATASGPRQVPDLISQLLNDLQDRFEVRAPSMVSAPPPDDPEVLQAFSLGSRLLDQGDAVQARPALEAAVQAAPGYAAAQLRLAQTYDSLGLHQQALETSSRAVSGFAGGNTRLALEARALDARLRGEPKQAQQILERLVEHFPNDSEARVALAEAYGEQGDLATARAALEEVAKRDPLHPRAWFLLGKYTIMAGDSRTAIDEHLVHALVIQNKLRNRQGQADVLNAMGVAYHRLDELDEAAEHYGRAAEVRREIGDQRGYATSLRNVAMVDTVRGRFQGAEENLEAARRILVEIGDQAGAAGLLTDLGVLAEERGDYGDALDAFRRALKLVEGLGDRAATADSYNNVGYAYYLLGEYDNAEVYWRQASDLFASVGNEAGTVQVTQNLGSLDLVGGDWNRAAAAFLKALEESRRLDLAQAEAVSLGALGEIALLRGRFAAARESIDGALALVAEMEDPRGLSEFTLLKAELELALGRSEAVEALLDEAEKWLADSPNPDQQGELATLRGRLALAEGDPRVAAAHFSQAQQVAENGGVVAPLRAALGAARAAIAAGNDGGVLDGLRDQGAAAEELGHIPLMLEIAETAAAAGLRFGELDAAEAAILAALQRIEGTGGYRRSFHLHRLHAEVLERRQPGSGAEAFKSARQELERLRSEVDEDHREALDSSDDVQRLEALLAGSTEGG